jgi:hypothetical protein
MPNCIVGEYDPLTSDEIFITMPKNIVSNLKAKRSLQTLIAQRLAGNYERVKLASDENEHLLG